MTSERSSVPGRNIFNGGVFGKIKKCCERGGVVIKCAQVHKSLFAL
jgi:hypothetical protein